MCQTTPRTVKLECQQCEKHKPDGCPGTMGECVKPKLELTKEEAETLYCQSYTQCDGCDFYNKKEGCLMTSNAIIRDMRTAREKLKAIMRGN